jgi:5-formyltetrahydrofolate cyclo-ligase
VTTLNLNRSELRKTLRQQRQLLTTTTTEHAAQQLTERCINHPCFLNSRAIAAYLSWQGEIEPMGIMQAAWELGKTVYIPALHPTKIRQIQFVHWTPNTPLTTNRYGILEHAPPGDTGIMKIIAPELLDLVLLPLVGFDQQCNRLGTGGGYYDRTFAFLQNQPRPAKPLLMGIAYEFQCVDTLHIEHWDVPLDGVITDKSILMRN